MTIKTLPITEAECVALGNALRPAPMYIRARQQSERAVYWASRSTAIIKALALGQAVLLTRYSDTRHVSSTLERLTKRYGMRFKTEIQRSLIDGEIEGVLVSRIE